MRPPPKPQWQQWLLTLKQRQETERANNTAENQNASAVYGMLSDVEIEMMLS